MIYTKLYASDDGASHFATVKLEFTATEYVSGAPSMQLSPAFAAAQVQLMKTPAGWSSDWHPSANRSLFFVLSGEWEVTASDGETRCFAAGSALLAEDTIGKGHRSRVLADAVAVMTELKEKR